MCSEGSPAGKNDFRLLIDCGLFQGPKEWRERNWQELPIPARSIDAVVLTHAHLDHSGWIPRLVKEGFRGPIYATPATIDLCGILLPDSGHLQEEDAAFYQKKKKSRHDPALPLYTFDDAKNALQFFRPVQFGDEVRLSPEVSFRFARAGHILGSAMAEIASGNSAKPRRLLFTGDIGRVRNHVQTPGKVVNSGPTEGETADILVMESTYGNRAHPTTDPAPELAAVIRKIMERGGSIVVPAFAVERTQKFVFLLKQMIEAKLIPPLPVFCDSPMAIEAVQIFLKYADEYSEDSRQLIAQYGSPLDWPGFTFASTPEQSKKINDVRTPIVIISSSGMVTGGRILHHLAQRLPDPRNCVIFIGFQAPGTRGYAIKNGAREIKIFGDLVQVRAEVVAFDQFSDHADTSELLRWLHTFCGKPSATYLVHGEAAAATQLRETISDDLGWKVEVAQWMQKVKA